MGHFKVKVVQHPRYVDMDKCIACGECAQRCPRKVKDDFNWEFNDRKAIYIKYSQAVPLKYVIDRDHCIYFEKGKCRACEKFCPTGAINFEDQGRELELDVGAIILSAGSDVTNPKQNKIFGYELYPNVMTAAAFERILSASGPFRGHLVRPSDQKPPKKIAWIQCVGSRDVHEGSKPYCSSVCCTYAVKEAVMAKEHVPGLDTAIFCMDMRTCGKGFDQYCQRAIDVNGVRIITSRVPTLHQLPDTDEILINYLDDSGHNQEEIFDIVVLSTGLSLSLEFTSMASQMGVEFNEQGYPRTATFAPVATSMPGILVCGSVQAPKDISSSVVDASAAAGVAGAILADVRGSRIRTVENPPEMDISGQPPRIGVFVCRCGTNIAGVVDVPAVVEFARDLPFVEYVEDNLFTCSQDTQDLMAKAIKEQNLNRVVVAACTPRTHEAIFQDTLVDSGLNKYLFEMANIRNHCSWVHQDAPDKATDKAKALVRMAVAKATLLRPLAEAQFGVIPQALVVGGGVAGLVAARTLAEQGFETHLIEKTPELGGHARSIPRTWKGENVQEQLAGLVRSVQGNSKVHIHTQTEIVDVDGSVGRFRTTIRQNGRDEILEHGAAIIATGADEWRPDGYLYGQNPAVLTGLELSRRLLDDPDSFKNLKSIVFLLCAGSRSSDHPYCSKVGCSLSLTNGLRLLEINPDMNVFVVYRDIRTYGLREALYNRAREKGIRFVRFDVRDGVQVDEDARGLGVSLTDQVLGRKIQLRPEMVVLATAVVQPKDNPIARMFKLTVNADGFLMEAHVKLRPVDFSTDGVFVCGLAHGPKPIDESVAQAQAAAARAVTVLSSPFTRVTGLVAEINRLRCTGCGLCVQVCPYQAINLNDQGIAEINESLCKGCGTCVASCRCGAPSLRGFTNQAVFAQIAAC